MDLRFIAVIFLIAALMEMLSKLARKRRGEEEELEEREAPRIADPLAGVLEEMRRLPGEDEVGREVGLESPEHRERERRAPGGETGFGVPESPREPVVPVRPPQRERPAADSPVLPSRPERAPEPVTSRGQIERMFEPMPQPPAVPVIVPEPPPPPAPVVPRRDRSPRPVEVRSREVRPREARNIAERAWTEERDAQAGVPKPETDGGRRRVETRRGGEGAGLDLGSVGGLRRLVVAREVLGPPLALRREEPFTDR